MNNLIKKDKKLILISILFSFVGLILIGFIINDKDTNEDVALIDKYNTLKQNVEKIKENESPKKIELNNINSQINDIKELSIGLDEQLSSYNEELSKLSTYREDISKLNDKFSDISQSFLSNVGSNYDNNELEYQEKMSDLYNLISSTFDLDSNIIVNLFLMSQEGMKDEIYNQIISLNEYIQNSLTEPLARYNMHLNAFNTKLDTLNSLIDSSTEPDKVYLNLDILDQMSNEKIDDSILNSELGNVLYDLTEIKCRLEVTVQICEVILTESAENKNFISKLQNKINTINTLLDTYNKNSTYSISKEDKSKFIIEGIDILAKVMDRFASLTTSSSQIHASGLKDISGNGVASRVTGYVKGELTSKDLVIIYEDCRSRNRTITYFYNKKGDPLYIERSDSFQKTYIFNGEVIKTDIQKEENIQKLLESSKWIRNNYYSLGSNGSYLGNTTIFINNFE